MNFPHPALSDEHLPFPLVALVPSSSGSGSLISSSGQYSTQPQHTSTKLVSQSLGGVEPEDFDKMLDMLRITEDAAAQRAFPQEDEVRVQIHSKDTMAVKDNGSAVKEDDIREGRDSGVSLGLELEDRFSLIRPHNENPRVQIPFIRHPSASSTSSSQHLTTSSEPVRFPSYNSTYPSHPVSFGSPVDPMLYHRPHSVASDEPLLHENIFSKSHSSPRSTTNRRERRQSTSSRLPSSRSPGPSSSQMALKLQPKTRESNEALPSLPLYLQSPMQEIIFKNKVFDSSSLSELAINSDPLVPPGLPLLESTFPSTQLPSTPSTSSSSSSSSPSSASIIEERQSTRSTHFSTLQAARTEASQITHTSTSPPYTLSSSRCHHPSPGSLFKPKSISDMASDDGRPSSQYDTRIKPASKSLKSIPQQTYQSSIRGPSPKRRTSVRSLRYEEREDEYEEEDNEDENEQAESTDGREEFLNRPLGLLALSHALAAANEEVGTLRSVVRDVNTLVTEQAALLLTSRYLPSHIHPPHSTSSTSHHSSGNTPQMRETRQGLGMSSSKPGRRARRDEDWLSLSRDEIDEFSGAEARQVLKAITSPQLGLSSTIAFLRHIEFRLNPPLDGAPLRSDDDVFSDESFQRMNSVLDGLILGQQQEGRPGAMI